MYFIIVMIKEGVVTLYDVIEVHCVSDLRSSQFFSNGTSNSFRNVAPPLFSTANNTASNDVIMEQLFQHMSNTSFTGITVSTIAMQHILEHADMN